MNSKRRNFLRGLMSVAGAATASTAYAQHEHPPAPRQAAPRVRPAALVPPDKLGPGVVPVVTPDVPDMPWQLVDGVTEPPLIWAIISRPSARSINPFIKHSSATAASGQGREGVQSLIFQSSHSAAWLCA